MSFRNLSLSLVGSVALFGSLVIANPANAQLTLTAQGIMDGFNLATFATTNPGNTGCCAGPFGIAVNGAGNVVVGTGSGPLYVFKDVNGQTPATALFTQSTNSNVGAYTSSGGVVYGATFGGNYISFNPDGTVANPDVFPLLAGKSYLGMWTNPSNGHIISNSTIGMLDINPTTGNYNVVTGSTGDGVSVSPDGKTAYSEQGNINGYDIATGTQVFSAGGIPNPDGMGVITGGKFNGDIVVNSNIGSIFLLDPITKISTEIASGGTRGDYTQVDPTNGTLFLDYSDIVARLSCPNCTFSTVPEPSTWAMMLLGFAGLGFAGLRKAKTPQAAPSAT
jgi:hypothetical protein